MKQPCRILLLCLLLSSAHAAEEEQTLHAIIVCDTLASNIGPSCAADLNLMQREAKAIAKQSGMTLSELIFQKKSVNRTLLERIDEYPINSDDTVLFYFSGHGYRTPSKGDNIWPNLFFTSERRGVDFYAIVQRLRQKGPRLLIAIADACNNLIPDPFAPPLLVKGNRVRRNYKMLFADSSGSILISGCLPEQYSWCTRQGGIYTRAFLLSLHIEVHAKEPDWQVLLERASLSVMKWEELNQTPQFELSLY